MTKVEWLSGVQEPATDEEVVARKDSTAGTIPRGQRAERPRRATWVWFRATARSRPRAIAIFVRRAARWSDDGGAASAPFEPGIDADAQEFRQSFVTARGFAVSSS
jgi:hypothetical protein